MTKPIPIAHARRLDEEGYVRLDGFIAPGRHRRIVERIDALFAEEGETAGSEFRQEPGARRLANLADKGDVFIDCVVDETVGQYLAHVLGPRFKLSSLNARSANPHSAQSQPLHIDAGALPDEIGYWVCNTVWLLYDFTTENGALRVVPGSPTARAGPQDVLGPRATHPDEVLVTGRAGDLVVMNPILAQGHRTCTDRRRLALRLLLAGQAQQQSRALLRRRGALSPALRCSPWILRTTP